MVILIIMSEQLGLLKPCVFVERYCCLVGDSDLKPDFPDPFFSQVFFSSSEESSSYSFFSICRVYVNSFNTGDRGSFLVKNDKEPSYDLATCFNKHGAVCFGEQVAELPSTVRMLLWEA